MEQQDVGKEVAEALRRYGFYIFSRDKQEAVREVLRELGELRVLVKVRGYGEGSEYFILEVDRAAFEPSCRSRCTRNGVLLESCYVKCLLESSRNVVEKVVTALTARGSRGEAGNTSPYRPRDE